MRKYEDVLLESLSSKNQMKERIKQLIEEYKEAIVELREEGETAIDERYEFKITKLGISIYNFEVFIKDLEELLKL